MTNLLEKLDLKTALAEAKELIAKNKVTTALLVVLLVLFPIASIIAGVCWLVLRKVSTKWVKVLAWMSAVAFATWLVLRKIAFLLMLVISICDESDSDRHRCVVEISKVWQSMSSEEKRAYMSNERLKQMTGIGFPEYDVTDYWDMTVYKDPCCTWVLELREEFDKSYLEHLCERGVLEYDESDSTYLFEYDDPDFSYADVECSDFVLTIKGTEVVVNDCLCACK